MKEFSSCKLLVPALRGNVLYEILQLLSQKLRLMFSLKQLPPDQANLLLQDVVYSFNKSISVFCYTRHHRIGDFTEKFLAERGFTTRHFI